MKTLLLRRVRTGKFQRKGKMEKAFSKYMLIISWFYVAKLSY